MNIDTLHVKYKSTSDPLELSFWLAKLPKVVAIDFETASKFSDEEKAELKQKYDALSESKFEEKRIIKQQLESSGLSHPSLVKVTHMSIGISATEAIVVIFDKPEVLKIAMNWLVTTNIKQIWHNASFDFKLIYYYTNGKIPKNFEDTQQYAKSILNHVDTWKANSKLKHLMGHAYGSWAVSPDMFHITNLYNETLLQYAAIDAAATYKLWELLEKGE